ncbi:MAG TPA: hypothetical protein VGR28_03075 [Candidatus Thermoplasmatota archaeon]|jgi:hypothetical protein|nr:hypothetical protein [Candidatus Thermoplasmatota archaeon]
MILCEKCGRVIQAYEVKYRLEVDGRRRVFCNEDAKDIMKGSEAPKAAKPAAAPAPKPGPAPSAAPAAAAPPKPALTPEELEARKKDALEKAAAAKAAKAASGEAPKA